MVNNKRNERNELLFEKYGYREDVKRKMTYIKLF